MEVHNNIHTMMHEDNKTEAKTEKETVSVRLDAVPVKTHNKIKTYRKGLIKKKGRVVTLTEAYYEFLKTR